jgi:hypothetical protein
MWYEKNWFYYDYWEEEQLKALLKTIEDRGLDNIQDMLYWFLWDIENWDYKDINDFVKRYKYFLTTNNK